jgi:hypothetical protein
VNVPWLARAAGGATILLALIALGTLLVGLSQPPQPPAADEGTLAHIFQLALGLMLPAGLLYLAAADWSRPFAALRPLVISGVIAAAALVLLYRFEHG